MGGGGGKGGGGGSAPKPPDYVAAAKEQGEQNRQAAYENTVANRPTQYDVWGNKLSWTQNQVADPEYAAKKKSLEDEIARLESTHEYKWGTRSRALRKQLNALNQEDGNFTTEWTQNINLAPEIQAMYDQYLGDTTAAQQAYGQRLQDVTSMLSNQFSAPNMPQGVDVSSLLSGMPNLPDVAALRGQVPTAPDVAALLQGLPALGNAPQVNLPDLPTYDLNAGQQVSDALYGSIMDRARPEQQRETDALATQLRLQGLTPGTEAYDRAAQNLSKAHGDVQTLAAQNATLAGYDEARQRYMAQLQGYGAGLQGEQTRLSGYDRELAQRQSGLQDINAMLAGYGAALQGYNTNLSGIGQELQAYQLGSQNQLSEIDRLLQQYQLDLSGQAQQFGQQLTERTQPLEELSFLAQLGSPINPSFSGFSSATGYSPGDLLGAQQASYNAQLGQYNAGTAQKGNLLGAGATLGGAYLGSKL